MMSTGPRRCSVSSIMPPGLCSAAGHAFRPFGSRFDAGLLLKHVKDDIVMVTTLTSHLSLQDWYACNERSENQS